MADGNGKTQEELDAETDAWRAALLTTPELQLEELQAIRKLLATNVDLLTQLNRTLAAIRTVYITGTKGL